MEPAVEPNPSKCRKCASFEVYIILDKVHLECRSCFLESCNRKIRSAIGKSHLVRNNDSLLLAYSGGPSSCALLHLIKNSIDLDTRREQKFRPSILHIDEQSALLHPRDQVPEFRATRQKELEQLLSPLLEVHPTWPIYWTTLESYMADEPNSFVRYNGSCDNGIHLFDESLQVEFHDSILTSDLTDKQRVMTIRCRELISRTASAINETIFEPNDKLKFVFTASSATQLANDLMVHVILGQGAGIRSLVSTCDRGRHPEPVFRPMRDFSKKEIAFYLRACQLDPPPRKNLLTMTDRRSSIQKATESFLAKLYVDYPSTYNTLLKTGDKMQE